MGRVEGYDTTVMKQGLLAALSGAAILGLTAAGALGAPGSQFTFAVIGDRTEDADDAVFEQVLREVTELSPDLVLGVGDLIEGYTSDSALVEGEWNEVMDLLDATGIQYHLTPGNHDIFDPQSRAIHRRRFGAPDTYFRFMDCVFVIMDVSAYGSSSAVPQGKLDWLAHVLEVSRRARGIFVFYHRPFWAEDFSAGKENAIHSLLVNYPVKAVFTGHYHRYFHTVRDGIQYFGVSSSGGSLPPGGRDRGAFYAYMLARMSGDTLSVNLVEPGIFTPIDVVTLDDAVRMATVEAGAVELSELVAYDYRMSNVGQVTITVENPGSVTLTDTARWVLRGDWAVEPMRDYVEVPPDEVGKLTAFVRCDGYLFPVPILEMRVPCCDGRTVEIVKPLNVKRVIYADYADSAPVIDGVLGESVWRATGGETEFFGPQGGRSPADSTILRICYDETDIYFGVECLDRGISKLQAGAVERDGLATGDDAVTFLFQLPQDARVFYQIAVNPAGTIFDRKVDICPFGTYVSDPSWNGPVQAATRVLADRWVLEMAFPKAALAAGVSADTRWGFNFMRIQQRLKAGAYFQAPLRYRADAIGALGFR